MFKCICHHHEDTWPARTLKGNLFLLCMNMVFPLGNLGMRDRLRDLWKKIMEGIRPSHTAHKLPGSTVQRIAFVCSEDRLNDLVIVYPFPSRTSMNTNELFRVNLSNRNHSVIWSWAKHLCIAAAQRLQQSPNEYEFRHCVA